MSVCQTILENQISGLEKELVLVTVSYCDSGRGIKIFEKEEVITMMNFFFFWGGGGNIYLKRCSRMDQNCGQQLVCLLLFSVCLRVTSGLDDMSYTFKNTTLTVGVYLKKTF